MGRLKFLLGAAQYSPEERRAADDAVWRVRNRHIEYAEMGRGSYGDALVVREKGDAGLQVRIGQFCSIAREVEFIVGGNHHPEWVSTFPFRIQYELDGAYADGHPWSKGDIVVGNDVWIGRGAKVLSGVTIGDGAVVGAYCVVTKDVRPYAIVAGIPAVERRRRFTDSQVERLLSVAWWNWPLDRILAAVPSLCDADIENFLLAHSLGAQSESRG